LVAEKLDAKPVMPDPRWPLAEPLLAYFICAIDCADAEFENIAVQPTFPVNQPLSTATVYLTHLTL